MRRENRMIRSYLSNMVTTDFPARSLIEIYDRRRILIERHLGIQAYNKCEVIVKISDGCVCICGDNLCVTHMCKEKLVITGSVFSVCLRGRKGNENSV